MTFTPQLVAATIDGATATLTAPLTYQGRTDTFTIPAAFTTDFASVPNFCAWLIPKMGTYTRAAILHDWLCSELESARYSASLPAHRKPIAPASARDVDGLFCRVMREEGVPFVRRWLMWAGVRWGALFTPTRRAGWWRDLPTVALITTLAAPLVIPISTLCLIGAAIDKAVEGLL